MRKLALQILLCLVLVVGCATTQNNIQEQWEALAPDEKTRIVCSDLQGRIDSLLDSGIAYVAARPQYKEKWQKEIIPAFDVANKMLKTVMILAQQGEMTPDKVYAEIQPLINSIITLMVSIGWVEAKVDLYPVPMHAAVDVALILVIINGLLAMAFRLWETLRMIAGKQKIPSWEELIDRNKLTQAKIDSEK